MCVFVCVCVCILKCMNFLWINLNTYPIWQFQFHLQICAILRCDMCRSNQNRQISAMTIMMTMVTTMTMLSRNYQKNGQIMEMKLCKLCKNTCLTFEYKHQLNSNFNRILGDPMQNRFSHFQHYNHFLIDIIHRIAFQKCLLLLFFVSMFASFYAKSEYESRLRMKAFFLLKSKSGSNISNVI